jgi:hypothetical protein
MSKFSLTVESGSLGFYLALPNGRAVDAYALNQGFALALFATKSEAEAAAPKLARRIRSQLSRPSLFPEGQGRTVAQMIGMEA